jgi:hypothetical protein
MNVIKIHSMHVWKYHYLTPLFNILVKIFLKKPKNDKSRKRKMKSMCLS